MEDIGVVIEGKIDMQGSELPREDGPLNGVPAYSQPRSVNGEGETSPVVDGTTNPIPSLRGATIHAQVEVPGERLECDHTSLVRDHMDYVFKFAEGFLGRRRELAADVAQEVLLRTMRAIERDQYQGLYGSSFKTWLGHIVMNECRRITSDKHTQANVINEGSIAVLAALSDKRVQVDDPADQIANGIYLSAGLESLTPKLRDAVYYRHVLGYSVEQTADVLGISVAAVKNNTRRGLKALRELMELKEVA